MRPAVFLAVLSSLFTLGCGYVGPVVPPSPMLPIPVGDLSVTERGDKLYITFNAPVTTTDALTLKRFSDIDLRIGLASEPLNLAQWQNNSHQYEVSPLPVIDSDDPKPAPITKVVPVSEWEGKKIAVAVRTAAKGEEHFSNWSNQVVLDVVKPLTPPVLSVAATGKGYQLTWTPERPGLHFQVRRLSPTDKAPVILGVAEQPEYLDATAQWETRYLYSLVAQEGASAESLPSEPVSVNAPDTFPPSIPTDVTVLTGPESVEISWTRSPETDTKGYLVYRSVNNGPLSVIGTLTTIPTFSDRKVEHGRTYQYAISAVDNKDNESEKSKPVQVTF